MFLFGILSSPLPYLLLAAFYFFGFATGMFHKEKAGNDEEMQIQVKNIQVEPQAERIEHAKTDFHFHQYNTHKKLVDCTLKSIQPPPYCQKEKLIYFVHDIKIPHSSLSDFYFCRPPPLCS